MTEEEVFALSEAADGVMASVKAKGEGVSYFLKLEGIDGECTDPKHKGELEVLLWNFFATQLGSASKGSGAGSGKAGRSNFVVSCVTSKASPKIFLACAKKDRIPTAVLSFRRAGAPQDFMKIKLSSVLIRGYQQSPGAQASDGSLHIFDEFHLSSQVIELEFKEENKDGTLGSPIKAGYNFAENKVV